MSHVEVPTSPFATTVTRTPERVALLGGILGALGAASCCVVPFALFSFGVSGAWIGNLTALAPYQPLFALGAMGFVGYGAYRFYRRRQTECAPGTYCASPRSDLVARIGLIAATVMVAGAMGFPYVLRALVS